MNLKVNTEPKENGQEGRDWCWELYSAPCTEGPLLVERGFVMGWEKQTHRPEVAGVCYTTISTTSQNEIWRLNL